VRKSTPAAPIWEIAQAEPETVEVPAARKSWGAADAREIQRVAIRLGAAPPGQDPQRTLDVLFELAREHHKDPDAQLRLYREVAGNACHDGTPACIRCPLRAHCPFHAELQQERKRTRSPLRRLWGT
jgi:adenine-specific DNA glycosylase